MGFTKDLWMRTVEGPDGDKTKERTDRYGRGKRWLAVWHEPDGRERSKAFEKKVDADNTWAAQETDVIRGDYIDPKAGRVLFGSLAKRWLRSRIVDPSSAILYERACRLHVEPTFGKRQVKGIKPSEVAEWLTNLGERYDRSTPRTALLAIQGILDLAVEDGSIKKNPALSRIVQRPSRALREIQPWEDTTVTRIIDAHKEMFRPIPVIGAACGLRQGEIYGLALEDIDFSDQVVRVRRQVKNLNGRFVFALPKNDRERTVPLSNGAAQVILTYQSSHKPRPCTLPWEQPDGKPHTASLLFRWTDDQHIKSRVYDELVWKPALFKAGVIAAPEKDKRGRLRYSTNRKTGLHALRHYYASVCLADGVNIRELAEYLGHADPAFTLRQYAHMLPSSHERARKAIDDRMFRPRLVATEQ